MVKGKNTTGRSSDRGLRNEVSNRDNVSAQKTTVDSDGTIRRTTVGADGTIYRTIISPDGTVRRLRKRPDTSSQTTYETSEKSDKDGHHSEEPVVEQTRKTAEAAKSPVDTQRKTSENSKTNGVAVNKHNYQKRKKKNTAKIKGLLILAVIIVLVVGGFLFFFGRRYSPTVQTTDLNAYYGIEAADQAVVIMDYNVLDGKALLRDDVIYLPYDMVSSSINAKVYVDTAENILLYAMPTYMIMVGAEATSYDENGTVQEMGHPVFTVVEGVPYISLDFVCSKTNIETNFYTDPNRVVITKSQNPVDVAVVKKTTEVRELGGPKSPILTQVKEGEEVAVLEDGDPYTKIGTSTGITGYMKDNKLGEISQKDMTRAFDEPVYTSLTRDHVIHMAWNQVTSDYGNTLLADTLAGTWGLNVVAPTWFFLTDTEGSVASIASADYVSTAHERGLEVWGVMNDFDGESLYGGPNSTEATLSILSSTSKRSRLEQTVIQEALNHGIDGINIDFEKINEECGTHYIQFIREMSILCRNNGLVLSVDTYVPSAWSFQYHRDEQNEMVDYVIIMAYDQNGSWSEEIGSNSDLPYVKDAIADSLKVVSPQKLIIGIPFYTRVWEETPVEGSIGMNFTCGTYGMSDCNAFLAANGVTPTWDDETGQYFATFTSGTTVYSVWLEDARSLGLKVDEIKANGLAGWACWKLGQETSDVWDVLNTY